jgi:hypothetical protein
MKTLQVVGMLIVAAIAASCFSAQEQEDDGRYIYKYVIKGHTEKDPTDRELSLRYDTETEAQKELEDKKYNYYNPKGLLYRSTDKPVKMRVAKLRIRKGSPSHAEDVLPDIPEPAPSIPIDPSKIPGFLKQPKKGDAKVKERQGKSFLDGKTGKGNIGKYEVTIGFADRQVVIRGEISGQGTYQETDGGVYMETERSTFQGVIRGNTMSGLWFSRDKSRPAVEWSITLTEEKPQRTPSPLPRPAEEPVKVKPQVEPAEKKPTPVEPTKPDPKQSESAAGEWRRANGGLGYYEFRRDGSGRYAQAKGTVAKGFFWSQDDDQVTINYKIGGREVAELVDGYLVVGGVAYRRR